MSQYTVIRKGKGKDKEVSQCTVIRKGKGQDEDVSMSAVTAYTSVLFHDIKHTIKTHYKNKLPYFFQNYVLWNWNFSRNFS